MVVAPRLGAIETADGKTFLALGASKALLDVAGVETLLASDDPDPGVFVAEANDDGAATPAFITAIGKHRHPLRETDPPKV